MTLRKNKLLGLIILLISSCSTSSFKVSNRSDRRTELLITPDRIILSCPKISDEKDIHLFMIPILDESNKVILVIQGNNIGQDDCDDRLKIIGNILKRGKKIYIAGMGYLDDPIKKVSDPYTFPEHGTFYDHGKSLQFMAIANEKGDCYSAYHGEDKPCPREPFPIEKNP